MPLASTSADWTFGWDYLGMTGLYSSSYRIEAAEFHEIQDYGFRFDGSADLSGFVPGREKEGKGGSDLVVAGYTITLHDCALYQINSF